MERVRGDVHRSRRRSHQSFEPHLYRAKEHVGRPDLKKALAACLVALHPASGFHVLGASARSALIGSQRVPLRYQSLPQGPRLVNLHDLSIMIEGNKKSDETTGGKKPTCRVGFGAKMAVLIDASLSSVLPSVDEDTHTDITWMVTSFEALTVQQLYDVLELRQRVFVLEQSCLFPDIDGADSSFLHLLAYDGDRLIAYSRMGDVGTSYPDALTIGRVIVEESARGRGLSYALMRRSIDAVRARYGEKLPITIGAQAHLQQLYRRLGFVATSDEYDEDGIMHIDMTLQ